MATEWKVLRHGAMEVVAPGVWTVEGALPRGSIPRRMMIVRGKGGGLIVHNAIALDEPGMKALDALGPVEMIVVPSALHRIDAPRFAARYPKAEVVTPRGARAKVAKVTRVDATYDEVGTGAGEGISFEHLDGTKEREGVVKVETPEGAVLVFNDAVMNLPAKMPGLDGWLFGVLGSLGGAKVTRVYRTVVLSNGKALAGHFSRLAQTPKLRALVPGHGSIVTEDPAGALRGLAGSL